MAARLVLSAITLALVGGGAALTLTGNIALIVVGVLLVVAGAIFGGIAVSLLSDPQAAAQKLLARRAELEHRTGRATPATAEQATEVVGSVADSAQEIAESALSLAPAAAANRDERRAAQRASRRKGRPARGPRR